MLSLYSSLKGISICRLTGGDATRLQRLACGISAILTNTTNPDVTRLTECRSRRMIASYGVKHLNLRQIRHGNVLDIVLYGDLHCASTRGLASSGGDKKVTEYDASATDGQLTVGRKVVQAGKDATYMVILALGFGVTGVLVWYIASELFFSFSPNSVYTKAIKLVKGNNQVEDLCGVPLKFYGEETSRGRRRHVSYQEYVVDGANFMRVKFYVAGSNRKGTVHADAKETSRGSFQFRFVFVEMQDFPHETVVLEDNRRDMM